MVLHVQRPLRVSFHKPILVRVCGERARSLGATAVNLSQSGLFASTPEAVPVGSEVDLSLVAGGKILPFAHGVVVRQCNAHHSRGLGIRFSSFHHHKASDMVDHLVSLLDVEPSAPVARPFFAQPKRMAAAVTAVLVVLMLMSVQMQTMSSQDTSSSLPPALDLDTPDSMPIETAPLAEVAQRRFYFSASKAKSVEFFERSNEVSVQVNGVRADAQHRQLLHNPKRLLIDIDARFEGVPKRLATGLNTATRIDISRHAKKTRLVIWLADDATVVEHVPRTTTLAASEDKAF
jgi:PilZ domain